MKSARQWALKALSRRMRTVAEVKGLLNRKGCPPDVVESVVMELQGLKYLDDGQFAQRWVSTRSRMRMLGRARLIQELRQKGVEEQTIRDALRESLDPELELALAREAAARKARQFKKEGAPARAALSRHLRTKGFSGEIIRQVLKEGQGEGN